MKNKTIMMAAITILASFLLTSCTMFDSRKSAMHDDVANPSSSGGHSVFGCVRYLTFEEAATMATDVVIAQYVTRRPFGQHLTEFEFIVNERIFGNSADRIFVYSDNSMGISGLDSNISYAESEVMFVEGTQYMLLLDKIDSPYARTHQDGFLFITNLTLDMNELSRSTMYNEPLAWHSTGLDFTSRQLSRELVVAYVSELTRNNTPSREQIISERLEDVIEGSPNVIIAEVNEPRRLAIDQVTRDWAETDIYYITVVRALKGNMEAGDVLRLAFFADTVQTGEQHIVAVEPVPDTESCFHMFTTRNSLFRMDQLDEIMEILVLR